MTSIHSRLSDSDTQVATVKGDEGVAVVYFTGGSIYVCDSCLCGVKESWLGHTGVGVLPRGDSGVP